MNNNTISKEPKNMSSSTHIYIEYKDKTRDNNWHLLKVLVPLENRVFDRDKPESEIQDITENLGGKLFCKSNIIVKRGIVRDLFNDQSKSFYSRGFPEDLGDDLIEIFQEEQSEIDILNEKDPSFNHDWRYGKSWCGLNELREAIEKSYDSVMTHYFEYKFSQELNKINTNLEKIYDHLNPPQENSNLTECIDKRYDASYEYLEELDDLVHAKGFCDHIYGLLSFVVGSEYFGDVRLIYYTN